MLQYWKSGNQYILYLHELIEQKFKYNSYTYSMYRSIFDVNVLMGDTR